jgi:hypothetical protein
MEDGMKALIAALGIALIPAPSLAQHLSVSSILPGVPLVAPPGRPTIGLAPIANLPGRVARPAEVAVQPEVSSPIASTPQCNMPVARISPDSEPAGGAAATSIINRAVPILIQRPACVNALGPANPTGTPAQP